MKKIAVLISNAGTGTNLQAIIDAVNSGKIKAKIAIVVSDKKDAIGLERAKKQNIPTLINPYKENLLAILKEYQVDYICLTGWKQFLTDEVINEFQNKIINLHPGLIPNTMDGIVKNPDGTNGLWNKKMFTEKALKNFFDKKATYAGSSIHFLTNDIDFGPVLSRCFEKILENDTIESLYARLKKKENEMYVKTLMKLCNY